jgi:hypothetical protein
MKKTKESKQERRRLPRVMAPVYYRSPRIFTPKRKVSDISLSGVRIYSDKYLPEGKRLEIEFFLPSGYTVEAIAKVVWVNELPPGSEALYDVGLEFIRLPEMAVEELKSVLDETPQE